jgi:hypothetical protein
MKCRMTSVPLFICVGQAECVAVERRCFGQVGNLIHHEICATDIHTTRSALNDSCDHLSHARCRVKAFREENCIVYWQEQESWWVVVVKDIRGTFFHRECLLR